jgi:hypothetical protein
MTLSITQHYAECGYAECHIPFVVMLNVIVLSVVMLNVIMKCQYAEGHRAFMCYGGRGSVSSPLILAKSVGCQYSLCPK